MDWKKSYSAKWRVFKVNRKTWADAESVPRVDSVNLSRTADGNLLESGSLTATGDFDSDYYRIVMSAEQDGEVARVDVATLLFDLSGGDYNHGTDVYNVNGFSVLYPASVTAITIGQYAPAGADGAQYVADLLKSAINAPVSVDGHFTLNDNIVFELGATVLDSAWLVLNAGPDNGFCMQIDGRGVVHILPMPKEPSLILDTLNSGLLTDGIGFTADLSEIPNRYVVIDDNIVSVAVNDDPNSPVSTVSRGYTVDIIDTSPALVDGETYNEYAYRMLKKNSILKEVKSYTREYAPNVYPNSLIRASIDGLSGDLRVQSQSITCGYGVTINERSVKEHKLYG